MTLLRLPTAVPKPAPTRPRRVRFIWAWVVVACLVVGHGCHRGGHDDDVEPMLIIPQERD